MKIARFILGPVSTNCYVVWDDSNECFIVDPADFTSDLRALPDSEGLIPKYIILTHAHGDHIGGIPDILENYPDIRIAVGKNDVDLLTDPARNYSDMFAQKRVAVTNVLPLNDGDELAVGDMKLKIIATPGHTEGGICIYTGSVLFSGDTLFRASIGRTDLHGGDFDQLVTGIREKLFALPDDTIVYPGHMDETTIGYEKKFNPYV